MTDRDLVHCINMWRDHRSTADMARALKIDEADIWNVMDLVKPIEDLPKHFVEASRVMRERMKA